MAKTKTFDTPCDIHFTAAFFMFSIRFSTVSDLLSVFCSSSLTPKWKSSESLLLDSRFGLNYTGHALAIIYQDKAMVLASLKIEKFWEEKYSLTWIFCKWRYFHKYKDIIVIKLAFKLFIQGRSLKCYWGISHVVSRTPSIFFAKSINHYWSWKMFVSVFQRRKTSGNSSLTHQHHPHSLRFVNHLQIILWRK